MGRVCGDRPFTAGNILLREDAMTIIIKGSRLRLDGRDLVGALDQRWHCSGGDRQG